MRRKIYQTLLDWKKERKGEVALLIEGARRIGKSHIVEAFGREEYDSYILVDFSKVNPLVMDFSISTWMIWTHSFRTLSCIIDANLSLAQVVVKRLVL